MKTTPLLIVGAMVLVLGGHVVVRNINRSKNQSILPQSKPTFALNVSSFTPYQPTISMPFSFSVIDKGSATLREFATVHEKIMHVIVVRKDLQEFQHVHPNFDEASGMFTLNDLVFPTDGMYRIFADFTPRDAQKGPHGNPLGVTLHEDVAVGTLARYIPQPIGDEVKEKTFGAYQVTLKVTPAPIVSETETKVSFSLRKAGKLVTGLESYLGALGHTVVLREGDLEFIHTHPLSEKMDNQMGTVDFMVTFPRKGMYKLFSQFQHQGTIITSDFVVSVLPGTDNPPPRIGQHN